MDNKLENVINRLAHAIGPAAWRVCGGVVVNAETVQEAISLLKAQVPRVMTLEEAIHNAYTYRISPDSVKPVFVQFRFDEYADEGLCPPWRGGINQRALVERTEAYGRDYVFWTDRPTKEQMEATSWD